MNLALPALVILLGLLPGIAFFYGFFSGRFEKRAVGVSGFEELALYVVFAIPLDAIALSICRWFGLPLNFEVTTHLLIGGNAPEATIGEIADALQGSAVRSAWTYLAVLFVSGLGGSFFRRFVWACRLDTIVPHFRLKHAWFYVLQGRMPGQPRTVAAYADVLTTLPEKEGPATRLYRGLVVDFEIAPDGHIDSLMLTYAVRGKGRGADFKWIAIPSDRLVIMGSTIHSINITYIDVESDDPVTYRNRFKQWRRSFWREVP